MKPSCWSLNELSGHGSRTFSIDWNWPNVYIRVPLLRKPKPMVVGVIYRMPNTCMEIFNDRMSDIMNIVQRERKICYFVGDLNVDLLKHESHQSTVAFLDSFYSYNVFPLITKPTRVTRESASLIDHVLTNNFDINSKHVQGILCTSISDLYAIFHIAGNAGITSADDIPVLKRNFTQNNMTRFTNEMENVDWEFIKHIDDTQRAYSMFHNLLIEKNNSCFPLKSIKKTHCTKSLGLQEHFGNPSK